MLMFRMGGGIMLMTDLHPIEEQSRAGVVELQCLRSSRTK